MEAPQLKKLIKFLKKLIKLPAMQMKIILTEIEFSCEIDMKSPGK